MLTQVADGVLVHQSALLENNTVVVEGPAGVLLVDPGITGDELACLADDLRRSDRPVVAGFATHPDWDHVLWHAELGEAPRYGTARCAAFLQDLLSQADWADRVAEGLPPEIAEDTPLELFGRITGLSAGAEQVPWDGPRVRIIEHPAHAPGHAALLIEGRGVLVAGDMLSDVLIPMLDGPHGTDDPVENYLLGLHLLDGVADEVEVVVPGHGSVGGPGQVRARMEQDRAPDRSARRSRVPSCRPRGIPCPGEGRRARAARDRLPSTTRRSSPGGRDTGCCAWRPAPRRTTRCLERAVPGPAAAGE